MKTLHKLREKPKFFESEFFVFDTETTPFKTNERVKFIFGVVYGYGYKKIIHSVQEFREEFLKPMYNKKKVFAHNAEFDLNVLYDNVYLLDKRAIFNGNFICATNEVCTFADSMNIFPTSVKNIGKLIGKDKKELSKVFWDSSEITENDINYCIRDCEIIFDALLEIFNKAGAVKITLAGLSMDLFRRFYQKLNIEYDTNTCNKFFDSYYGGRCEAFYIGDCNGTVYDINSMYPYAMYETKFPNPKYLKTLKNVKPESFIENYLDNYEGMCFCNVKHLDNFFGFLPLRYNDKLVFPTGTFKGHWNFNEIRFALANKVIEIIEVTEIVYAPAMESPFKDYVLECYRLRQENTTEFNSYLYKLFANSLYGKFAQKINSEQIYIEDMVKDFQIIQDYKKSGKLKEIKMFNEFRNDCFIEIVSESIKYMSNTIPVFSSYITSFARVELLKKILEYKEFKPLYCDTDSVFFAIDPLIANSKLLGEFKKEDKIINHISGLKNYDYICDNKKRRKLKGVPEFTDKEKTQQLEPINNIYNYESLVKSKEGLRRNIQAGTFIKRTKQVRSKYDKRNVSIDGETTALHLFL